ncbi:type II toxin-antitoxin system ParD family antitoxin [Salinisphaera sp.]|uniref:type II toxin-antitoxin system ParD family antitoxin n=1 Tax=Salinisphaera sp. TaxID=1914330 RepID=UPI002D79E551|nr:type II toxin-antitoxin system ParD family antitoxin [Salinisphaera sp.]HET7312839.1 type II toxin-antitoxin system ParD family antitoxin [Salinisphaera sp.]
MTRNTSIVLGSHLEDFVAEQVRAGGYASASEVVRAGLRLLEAADARTRALRQALIEGETSGLADYDYDSFVASLDCGA